MPVSGVTFEASKHKCGVVQMMREVDEMGVMEGFQTAERIPSGILALRRILLFAQFLTSKT